MPLVLWMLLLLESWVATDTSLRPILPEGFPLEKFPHPECQPGLSTAL